jgi:tRNA modification GTPase
VNQTDTIAAIATAPGRGAIGIIRLSGPQSLEIATALGARTLESHRARVCRLTWQGDVLDEALVLPFLGPGTFTGEHCLELHCHGGPVTLRRVLDAVQQAGARIAEPGEFARRAMLNGKLDLVQVEAIADIIEAESDSAHAHAQRHLAGALSGQVDALKERLVQLVLLVEAAIDFSLEEHVYTITPEEMEAQLGPIRDGVGTLLATYQSGRLHNDGVRVALVGRPNAGKSTLLNTLLGEDRALVTPIAGTTRDYLEEKLTLDGVLFRLIDTAGLRETEDEVERLGVARTRERAAGADAVLVVADASSPEELPSLLAELPQLPTALLWNKCDLVEGIPTVRGAPGRSLAVSLSKGVGVDELPELLLALAESAGLSRGSESVLLTRARHRDTLTEVATSLERATEALELGHELVALDLRIALDGLGSLTGAVTTDDLLDRIFAGFCIGK